MLPYQDRVVEEKSDLDSNIEKLANFIESTMFDDVEPEEQERMANQLNVMRELSDILGERIDNF